MDQLVRQPEQSDRASRICLGTAQIGMDYGVANTVGRPSDTECAALLEGAIERGVVRWDTARSYGDAEARIGRFLRDCQRRDDVQIISKLPCPPPKLPSKCLASWVTETVDASLRALQTNRLAGLLIHDAETVRSYGNAIWDAIQQQVVRGVVERIGLSVYDLEELQFALDQPATAAVQFPMNLWDHRFARAPIVQQAVNRGVTCYARSVLLQGVLTMNPITLPPRITHLASHLERLHQLLAKYEVTSLDVALPWVLDHPEVPFVVIGVDNVAQLHENLERARAGIPLGLAEELWQAFRDLPTSVLEPRRW